MPRVKQIRTPLDLESLRSHILNKRDPNKQVVRICCTTGCRAGGALTILDAVKQQLAERGLGDKIEVKETGCRGFCENGPVMAVEPQGVFYNLKVARNFVHSCKSQYNKGLQSVIALQSLKMLTFFKEMLYNPYCIGDCGMCHFWKKNHF
jgi:(2Fe-2S) ferredoxin